MNWSSILTEMLFYVVFAGVLLRSVKRKEETDEGFSKITTQCLKGICCVAIFGHHYGQVSKEPVLGLFTHFGYLVLNIFLVISGYGVSFGLKNKKNYLNDFLIRRCGRIILCYWIMNGLTVIVEYIFYGKIRIDSWKRELGIFFLRDASYTPASWYIMMLFWLYLFFYLAARFGEKYLQVIMFLAVSGIIIYNIIKGMPLWYYNYLYSFNVGIYMAYRKEDKERGQFLSRLVCGFGIFALSFVVGKIDRIIAVQESFKPILNISAVLSSTVLAVTVMYALEKFKLESKLLYMLGGISTSVYVFHTCVMLRSEIQTWIIEYIKNWGVCLWISLGITIAVSAGIKKLLSINLISNRNGAIS